MSAVNAHETSCVLLARRGRAGLEGLWRFLIEYRVSIVPFDETQARLAADAYARYGKGLGSKAQLNLCDCAAYALARSLGAPLLFKGEDFSQTDVKRCV